MSTLEDVLNYTEWTRVNADGISKRPRLAVLLLSQHVALWWCGQETEAQWPNHLSLAVSWEKAFSFTSWSKRYSTALACVKGDWKQRGLTQSVASGAPATPPINWADRKDELLVLPSINVETNSLKTKVLPKYLSRHKESMPHFYTSASMGSLKNKLL